MFEKKNIVYQNFKRVSELINNNKILQSEIRNRERFWAEEQTKYDLRIQVMCIVLILIVTLEKRSMITINSECTTVTLCF